METRKRYDLTLARHDYPIWSGRPRRTILICSEQRSGSTLLGEALYFAGGLGCPLEYFHAGFRPDFEARWATHSANAYLDAVHAKRTDPNGTFSAKLFWRDIVDLLGERDSALCAEVVATAPVTAPAEMYRRIAATLGELLDGATYVHLRRLDRVRRAVSAFIAEQTGLWRSIPHVGERTALTEPLYDFDSIARLIARAERAHAHWVNLFAVLDVAPMTLTYEAITGDYTATLSPLLKVLGSDAQPPAPRLQRQSDRLSEDFALRYLRETQARLTTPGAAA